MKMDKVKLSIVSLSLLVLGTTFYSCNKGKLFQLEMYLLQMLLNQDSRVP